MSQKGTSMDAEKQSQKWQQQSQSIFSTIAQWREAHPRATMAESETAVDEQMQQLRAQVLQDGAPSSPTNAPVEATATEQPVCPDCGVRLQARGKRKREVQTHGGHQVSLTRTYFCCPRCGYGFFPPG